MPAKPLTAEQLADAARLKHLFVEWQHRQKEKGAPSSQESVAERLGFGQSALSQYLRGKIPLNPEAVAKFSDLLGVSQEAISPAMATKILSMVRASSPDDDHISDQPDTWIRSQSDDLIKRLLPTDKGNVVTWERPEDLEPDEDRVWIDRYDYHFSAGTGLIQWEVRQKKALPFDIGFFKALGSKPKDCKLLTVRGDSMEPFLFNRDMMMVDSARTHVRDGKVYAIYFEDEPLVKQVFKQVGGGIVLHSYNGKYPDRTVPAESMELVKIVGEVIYRSGSAMAGGN